MTRAPIHATTARTTLNGPRHNTIGFRISAVCTTGRLDERFGSAQVIS